MHTSLPRPVLPPMPIAIDNGLPHLTFALGSDSDFDPTLCGLMDTYGALNIGHLLFHLWLMSERPDLVAEFVSFDDSNPFEPIKLGGAICDPINFDASTHGNLTADIRYFTPYSDQLGAPLILSFTLGPDVTANTIFGLPMLCDLDPVISLGSNSLHNRALKLDFPITRAAAHFGLPRTAPSTPQPPLALKLVHAASNHPMPPPLSIPAPPLLLPLPRTIPRLDTFNAPSILPFDMQI
jgi:hypothetical protein